MYIVTAIIKSIRSKDSSTICLLDARPKRCKSLATHPCSSLAREHCWFAAIPIFHGWCIRAFSEMLRFGYCIGAGVPPTRCFGGWLSSNNNHKNKYCGCCSRTRTKKIRRRSLKKKHVVLMTKTSILFGVFCSFHQLPRRLSGNYGIITCCFCRPIVQL